MASAQAGTTVPPFASADNGTESQMKAAYYEQAAPLMSQEVVYVLRRGETRRAEPEAACRAARGGIPEGAATVGSRIRLRCDPTNLKPRSDPR